MNYLELQQRANLLVDKVNAYEESLVGQEIDETQILNEHKYADIFSLRPVLKLLFGATLEEKLNRTLDNDVALRVFASTAPAWKSSFNLLSYNPGVQKVDYSTLGDVPISEDGLLSKYNPSVDLNPTPRVYIDASKINFVDKTSGSSIYPVVDFSSDDDYLELVSQVIFTDNFSSSNTYPVFSMFPTQNTLNYGYLTYSPLVRLTFHNGVVRLGSQSASFGRDFVSGDILDFRLKIKNSSQDSIYFGDMTLTVTLNGTDTRTVTDNRIYFNYRQSGCSILYQFIIGYYQQTSSSSAGINGYQINLNETYMNYYQSSNPVGFETDTHEIVQNIDTYNNHNMLQLDVKQNEVITRDERIKKGINYSYSSNIADALVTESQVANIFFWNTTTQDSIANNLITFNRQVPGIVTYYLGNDYTSNFTATIPYNPRYDTINAVNYNTPPYYGAYYRDTDYTQSQVGLNPGAECCRIFMPGCNYTRGLLESPQQIWQPDKKVGNDNINLGYNWQGRAIYHELVFKNRRTGSSDNNVDFIPASSSIPDNDSQGLATRVVLAQQKPYYSNRLWFKELDNLYGVNCSKLADYITLNSISVPKLIKVYTIADFITEFGNINITDGVASTFGGNTGFKILQSTLNFRQAGVKFAITFTTADDVSTYQNINTANQWISLHIESGQIRLNGNTNSTICTAEPNTKYYIEFDITSDQKSNTKYSINDGELQTGPVVTTLSIAFSYNDTGNYGLVYGTPNNGTAYYFRGTIDLTNSYIQLPSDEAPQYLCNVTEKNKEVFNRNLFNIIGAAVVSNSGTLSNTSNNNYATADIVSLYSLGSIEILTPIFKGFSDNSSSGKMFDVLSDITDYSKRFGFGIRSFNHDLFEVGYVFYNGNSTASGYEVVKEYNTIQFRFTLDNTQRDSNSLNSIVKLYYRVDNEVDWTELWEREGIIYDAQFICTIGKKDNETTGTIELGPMTQTINDEIKFEGQSVPGTSTMNDEKFYNDYKLDYETYAKALDQPL
jgi:hypothetical protein